MQLARVLVCFFTVWAGDPASAQAQVSDEVILVLDISENGHPSPQLVRHLERQLERSSHKVHPSAMLHPEQRALRDQRLLIELASKTKSRLILWGDVQSTSDRKQRIELQLFDAASPENGGLDDFLVCPQEQLDVALPELADRLLGKFQRDKGQPGLVVVPPKPVAIAVRPREGRYRGPSTLRKAFGISIGVLAATALSGAIALNFLHGKATDRGPCPSGEKTPRDCVYNNTALFATGYSVAGVLALGSWLTLALPQ